MNLVHVGVGVYVEFATHCLLGLRIIMCVFMAIHIRCWHTYRYVNCTYELLPPPIHLYYMLVIDHMVPMCIMEVASRHLILLTSPPPTVAPLEPGSVSIMGLPLPFQVGPGEGGVGVWAVTGSGPCHVIPPHRHTSRSADSMCTKIKVPHCVIGTVWLRFMCVQCTWLYISDV